MGDSGVEEGIEDGRRRDDRKDRDREERSSVERNGKIEASPKPPPVQFPAQPTNVKVVGGDSEATVSWHYPAEMNNMTFLISTQPATQTYRTCQTHILIKNLVNGKRYVFIVTAANAIGLFNASKPSNKVKIEAIHCYGVQPGRKKKQKQPKVKKESQKKKKPQRKRRKNQKRYGLKCNQNQRQAKEKNKQYWKQLCRRRRDSRRQARYERRHKQVLRMVQQYKGVLKFTRYDRRQNADKRSLLDTLLSNVTKKDKDGFPWISPETIQLLKDMNLTK